MQQKSELEEICRRLEHFETPEWAARAILKKEILTRHVVDPCCGSGILAEIAHRSRYQVTATDIHDWGYIPMMRTCDWLNTDKFLCGEGFTVFMNPPFSLAEKFVEKSFELGARKVVCFQRFAWWESKKRRSFWQKYPPNRIYICGDRADCWRHDVPQDQRGSGTPTAHAWFVFEPGHPSGTVLGHIYKGDANG